ncbi:MAG: tRNA preQ1(34) S-adenosylmethionine ribosyltransferase-isomerase QueA [Desulfobacterales bacterium]|jgi:S-adenosylmethionine:tRNA ribosyltransferase-isomerase|nr:tRNA preQ1(34) S-adenosylmethionine ribosyltransferase-isomerase QueA [Desulfobacterales bacterium]
MHSLSDYDYELPAGLIAQSPAKRRDRSRLLRLERRTGALSHHRFERLPERLTAGDVLVVNDTAVIPARLVGRKATGGRVEVFILDYTGGVRREGTFACDCLVKSSKPLRAGACIQFGEEWSGRVTAIEGGFCRVEFSGAGDIDLLLDRQGHVPLPPYIRRLDRPEDRKAYQTVYAAVRGAVAAPTAGLHFTPELLEEIRAKGVAVACITLHVGYGTFAPVRSADIRTHRMHAERYHISASAAEAVNAARDAGRRVVAVGTTAVRTLEFAAGDDGRVRSGSGWCDLFIYPGYRFKAIDAMITNFHLPKSTLLMLVAAFAGREPILDAYRAAVAEGYRFYSYGDAMLIE